MAAGVTDHVWEAMLVLSNIDSTSEIKRIDIRGTEFVDTGDVVPGVELTFGDGKKMLLREED
jgi:hypothetical protein